METVKEAFKYGASFTAFYQIYGTINLKKIVVLR